MTYESQSPEEFWAPRDDKRDDIEYIDLLSPIQPEESPTYYEAVTYTGQEATESLNIDAVALGVFDLIVSHNTHKFPDGTEMQTMLPQMHHEIKSSLLENRASVIVYDNKVVAFAKLDPIYGLDDDGQVDTSDLHGFEFGSWITDSDYQGQKFGKKVLESTLDLARENPGWSDVPIIAIVTDEPHHRDKGYIPVSASYFAGEKRDGTKVDNGYVEITEMGHTLYEQAGQSNSAVPLEEHDRIFLLNPQV